MPESFAATVVSSRRRAGSEGPAPRVRRISSMRAVSASSAGTSLKRAACLTAAVWYASDASLAWAALRSVSSVRYVFLIHSAVLDLIWCARSSGFTLSMNAFASAAVGLGCSAETVCGVAAGAPAQAQRRRPKGAIRMAAHSATEMPDDREIVRRFVDAELARRRQLGLPGAGGVEGGGGAEGGAVSLTAQ